MEVVQCNQPATMYLADQPRLVPYWGLGFRVCFGEGNGNPLQYCCLENPTDGGIW